MKQILVITRTFREAVEDMRTLQGWILKYTVFKTGIEPHRGRITTEHAEVIFVSAQIEEKLLGIEGVLREIIEIEEAAVNEKKEN